MQMEERDPLGWVMKALREAGSCLVRELAGINDDVLRRRPAEGGLSLIEIAAHLRDAEELAAAQIACLIDTPGRRIPVRDLDLLIAEHDYRVCDLGDVLSQLRGMRRETTYRLWGMRDSEWRRPAKHPFRDDVTLEVIARELAQHDLEHLWEIRRLKHSLGAGSSERSDDWDDW
jgi:hypothetical protein